MLTQMQTQRFNKKSLFWAAKNTKKKGDGRLQKSNKNLNWETLGTSIKKTRTWDEGLNMKLRDQGHGLRNTENAEDEMQMNQQQTEEATGLKYTEA